MQAHALMTQLRAHMLDLRPDVLVEPLQLVEPSAVVASIFRTPRSPKA
jgi:hypothetical protein